MTSYVRFMRQTIFASNFFSIFFFYFFLLSGFSFRFDCLLLFSSYVLRIEQYLESCPR
jgi:hypothetical protein